MVPFVGRQAELAVLRARMAGVLAGRPQVVQISGPAGIGKTTLLEQFLRDADVEPRPIIVRASGEESEQLLVYGVVEQLARSAGPAGAGLLAAASVRAAGSVDDPVTMGTRILEFFDQLDPDRALIVAIDDANWADRPSLQALIFALRRLLADAVLCVIATRDDAATELPESLTRLASGDHGTLLRLPGLDEVDLRDLAVALGVDGIDARAARRLRYGTEGNPLHARALLEEFAPAEWGSDDQPLPSPRTFRRLVRSRYAACALPTRALVDAASVLGTHCPLPLVLQLAGIEVAALEAVDEAAEHGLLETSYPRYPLTVSFPHPLVRAAVYDALGSARHHELHAAAAELMVDESARLRHRVAAASVPDGRLAADLTRFADREARRQAWQSAAAHLVAASRVSPNESEAQRQVLRAVIWTMLRGDAASARTYHDQIAAYPAGPLRDAVLGSLAMAEEDPVAAEKLLAAAWDAAVTHDDPEVSALVALVTAIHCYGRLDAQATVQWCERTLASSTPESAGFTVAQTYLVHGLGYAGRTSESRRAADSADERPGDTDHLWLNPRSARGVLRLIDDDLGGARSDLESVAVTASRLGILNTAAFGFAYLARAEWVAGAWDDALLHAERAVAINLESNFGFMQSAVVGIALLVPVSRGDWAAVDGYLESFAQDAVGYERSVVALGMARARMGEARGDMAAVLAALEPVQRFSQRGAVDEPGFWPWQDLYADALVAAGRIAEADEFLVPHEKLAGLRGRRTAIARLARSRGRVEAAAGRMERSDTAFEHAIAITDGMQVPFERARIELAAGSVLRRVGQRRRAAHLLSSAHLRFAELGAVPYADRCATELAASGLAPTRRIGRDRAGLTSQELVVARLAAQGRSNRQLADELVVSIKTIEYHLRNAFAKLGIASRRELPDRLRGLAEVDR